ncbi:MAG: 2-oxo acid dehydrogenase subunit E2, partial [Chloroflexi bacterium]|nr:2-oxo acid dehydrogenase subunit E2 [Chloroflexota bacterium]
LRRESLKEEFRRREGVDLTYLPFVIQAVAEALREFAGLNASWGGDRIIVKQRINIGVAVGLDDGLIVPVIHDADGKSIAGLARALDDLVSRARAGRLTLEDVQGGTFTINNTGAFGSLVSMPIIHQPQAAILTTEAIVKRPVVIADAIAIRAVMNMCVSFDHRVLDGALVGQFMQRVKASLEATGPDTPVY